MAELRRPASRRCRRITSASPRSPRSGPALGPIQPADERSRLTITPADDVQLKAAAVHFEGEVGQVVARFVWAQAVWPRPRERLPVRAYGQIAFGAYAWEAEEGSWAALSLDVLTLEGTRVKAVTASVTPTTHGHERERFATEVFERLGIPQRLD